MRRRWLRVILALGFIAAAAGAGYALWQLDARANDTRAALAAFETHAGAASRSLADLRAGLQAYVAAGQQVGFWRPRVAAALDSYRAAADALRRLAPGAAPALTPAEDLAQLDTRTRELVTGDQALVASDLVFADGLEMVRMAAGRVDEALRARRAADAATRALIVRDERILAVGTLVLALLVILLLLPAGGSAAEAPAAAAQTAATDESALGGLDLALGAALDARISGTAPDGPDLKAAADLCGDLGSLSDPSSLPDLFERATGLLGAKGLILWLADKGGTLHASTGHGYGPETLARLGALRQDEDNATAKAYRTASLQTVRSERDRTGALAVPLVAAGGCAGVMAVEMEDGREQREDVRAVARIVAAQLATLIPAAPAAARDADEPRARAESG